MLPIGVVQSLPTRLLFWCTSNDMASGTNNGGEVRVHVFVSSPSELVEERAFAREVIQRLSGELIAGRAVELIPLLWEDSVPAVVGDPAQLAVDYYLDQQQKTDIYVGMFWRRLGSEAVIRQRRHESGTVYEFEQAYAGYKTNGRPVLLLYRCGRGEPAEINDGVRRFFDRFSGDYPQFHGLPQSYQSAKEFADRFERDLRIVVGKLVDNASLPRQSPPQASGERQILIDGIENYLASFDDLLGQSKEKSDAFPISFDVLDDPLNGDRVPSTRRVPGPDSSLLELFDRWHGRALIVGPIGAGKTFAMIRLMQELLMRSRQSEQAPIPIYFNLASWVLTHANTPTDQGRRKWGRSDTLDTWLIDELVRRYAVARRAATGLVRDRRIIFCLDGLDELTVAESLAEGSASQRNSELRAQCVQIINKMLRSDASVRMILCCRQDSYAALSSKPELGFPLLVRPIELEDCLKYLRGWANLDGLHQAMTMDLQILRQRARVPLFLRMMAVSYAGLHSDEIAELARRSTDEWENHLLDHYVQKCMSLVDDKVRNYTKQHVKQHLGWMAHLDQNDLLLEDIQPSLLSDTKRGGDCSEYNQYRVLSTLMLSLILTAAVALPCALAIGLEWTVTDSLHEAVRHTFWLVLFASASTLAGGLAAFSTRKWWVFAATLGIALSLVRGVTTGFSSPRGLGGTFHEGVKAAVVTLPCATAVFMLLGWQILGRIEQFKRKYQDRAGIEMYEIQPLETFNWQWIDPTSMWRGGWTGLVIGPVVGVILWRVFGPVRGISFGTLATVFVAIFNGLSGTVVRVSLQPNQGIIRSFRNATFMASAFVITGILLFGVCYGVGYSVLEGFVNGSLALGLAFTFLAFGGIPVIRHACLGYFLGRRGDLPSWRAFPPWRHTISFFEDMVRFKLLRRSAGGYMFRHESLRSYFRRHGSHTETSPT